MASPFLVTKSQITERIKRSGVCDAYYQAENATDYITLLASGCGFYNWLYRSGIVDDTILAGFDDADLNQYGVYKTNVTLSDPLEEDYLGCKGFNVELEEAPDGGQTLFFVGSSVSTVNLTGNNLVTAYVMGNSNVTFNLSGNSQLTLFCVMNATATVSLNDNSSACIESTNNATTTLTANGVSSSNANVRGNAIFNYTGNDTCGTVIRMFPKSTLNYTAGLDSFLNILPFGKVTLNDVTP